MVITGEMPDRGGISTQTNEANNPKDPNLTPQETGAGTSMEIAATEIHGTQWKQGANEGAWGTQPDKEQEENDMEDPSLFHLVSQTPT